MNYPADFVARCKSEYPAWDDLHEALDSGNVFAGRYLDDAGTPGVISASVVLEFLDIDDTSGLRSLAASRLRKSALYGEWIRIYEGTCQSAE